MLYNVWKAILALNFNHAYILKRIKYEIRLGKLNRPMSTSPKKVEPILCVGP